MNNKRRTHRIVKVACSHKWCAIHMPPKFCIVVIPERRLCLSYVRTGMPFHVISPYVSEYGHPAHLIITK